MLKVKVKVKAKSQRGISILFLVCFLLSVNSFALSPNNYLKSAPLNVLNLFSKEELEAMFETEQFAERILDERPSRKYARSEIMERLGYVGPAALTRNEERLFEKKNIFSWSSRLYRLALLCLYFVSFPFFQNIFEAYFGTNIDNEPFIAAITGGFIPVISILYGQLTSNSIAQLQKYQNNIRLNINKETFTTVKLTKNLVELCGNDMYLKASVLERVWIYINTVALGSRKQEVTLMLFKDPLLELVDMLSELPSSCKLQRAYKDLDRVVQARQVRLTSEGEGLSYAEETLITLLGFMIVLSYLALAEDSAIRADANIYTQTDVQLFYGLMLTGLTVADRFIRDLNRPFVGTLTLRKRSLTMVNLLQIKNIIFREMGKEWMAEKNQKLEKVYNEMYIEPDSSRQKEIRRHEINRRGQ